MSTFLRKNRFLASATLIFLLVFACWCGVSFGAIDSAFFTPVQLLWDSLFSHEALSTDLRIIAEIRLPRVIMAVLVGAALAVSGASIQGICRNPLADPGLIGISSGAAVGAVTVISFASHFTWLNSLGVYLIPFMAFVGAAIVTFSIYALAQVNGSFQIATLLLSGIAINAFCGAIIGVFSFIANEQALRLITFWMMGSLASANWQALSIITPICLICIYCIYRKRHILNLLLLGEDNAQYSGVDVKKEKNTLLWLNAILVGIVVAFSGVIGFIGLVIPHIIRVSIDTNYRFLLLYSAILGSSLLTIADIISRTAIAPAEIPIGILTSLIGAPFFIYLLLQQKRKHAFAL